MIKVLKCAPILVLMEYYITIQILTSLKEKDIEIVLVVQPLGSEEKLAFHSKDSAKKPKISEIIAGFRQLRR